MDSIRISLITPFVGKWYCINEYLSGLTNLEYDKSLIDLVFYDASCDKGFNKLLNDFIDCHKEYNSITLVVDERQPMHDVTAGNVIKTNRVASVYERLKKHINNDLLFVVEDDIEVPTDSLNKLLKLFDDQSVSMALGRQLCRWAGEADERLPLAWFYSRERVYPESDTCKEEHIVPKTFPILDTGIQAIEASAMGCNLIRSEIYKREVFRGFDCGIVGYDLIFGKDMIDWGYKILIDWSIHCKHYHLISGKVDIYQ